jgi:hypothetical protein
VKLQSCAATVILNSGKPGRLRGQNLKEFWSPRAELPEQELFMLLKLILVFVLISSQAYAVDTEFEVPPIVLDGESPAEALHEENPVPAQEDEMRPTTSSGTIDAALTQDLAVSVTPATAPGGLSQIRGLGRSAEEVSVEAFGVPLNPAQGGGFNFSIFPQFLWNSFSYRAGPIVGGSDPRAIAGGLVLRPWTADGASDPYVRSRVTAFYSGEGLAQFSTAYDSGASALLVGWSTGAVRGPTTSASFRMNSDRDDSVWMVHVLGTSLDLDTPGSTEVLTSRRIVPVLQNETKSGRSVFRTSFFYDGAYQSFTFPQTLDRTHQLGVEHAAFVESWVYGAAARHIRFEGMNASSPSETQLHLRLMRKHNLYDHFVLRPALQLIGVTQVGAFPEASVSGERALDEKARLYARLGFSRRIPSLVDRYYQDPYFGGNPLLKPETAWSLMAGYAAEGVQGWSWDLSALAQRRSDAIVGSILLDSRSSLTNLGAASIASVSATLKRELSAWWETRLAATFSASEVSSTGKSFPYIPSTLAVASVSYRSPLKDRISGNERWGLSLNARASTQSVVPGYGYFDLRGQVHPWDGIMLGAQVDNVLGRPIEIVSGVPPVERAVSAMVSGTF